MGLLCRLVLSGDSDEVRMASCAACPVGVPDRICGNSGQVGLPANRWKDSFI